MDEEPPLESARKMDAHALAGLAELGLDPARARARVAVERDVQRARKVAEWVDRLPPDPMVRVSRDDLRAVLDDRGDASETRFPAAAARLAETLALAGRH